MKIAFAATNPCHLFPLAKELHLGGHLETYYSGYPRWKLQAPAGMPIRSFPIRTLITYALLRAPHSVRPKDHSLFRWQDGHFDHKTSSALTSAEAIHGIPGQCLETFSRARQLGITTVLNHATGPTALLADLLRPEFDRVGLDLDTETAYDAGYLDREREEYRLADYHCVASSIVRKQLSDHIKIPRERIWTVPYAADGGMFRAPAERHQSENFRIVFAGQLSLRKGIRFLLDALAEIDDPSWHLHLYGSQAPETSHDLAAYDARPQLHFHRAVPQSQLAAAFRNADALVLPSIEEGFGLVVPQALNCGLPCIVSDAVGASDLIRHRENGSIFASTDSSALATELLHWRSHPRPVSDCHSWADAAQVLASFHNQIRQ